jgi:hypothetical protein
MNVRFAETETTAEGPAVPFWLMLGLVIALGLSLGAAASLFGLALRI